MSVPKWKSLKISADRARKGGDHQIAVDIYTQALKRPNIPWKAFIDLTLACAYCHKMLNQLIEADACLSGLAERASQHGDDATVIRAYTELIFVLRKSGDFKRGLQRAQEGLAIARRTGQPGLVAEALIGLGVIHLEIGSTEDAQTCLSEAQELSAPGDVQRQLKAYFLEGSILGYYGKYKDLEVSNSQALDIARSIGDRDWEGIFLNQLAIFTLDLSLRRTLYDGAREAFEAAGDQAYQALVRFNKAVLDAELGLHKSAMVTLKLVLDEDRAMGNESICLNELSVLSISAFLTNDLTNAFAYSQEGLALARKTGSSGMEFIFQANLSLIELVNEQPAAALDHLEAADALPYQKVPQDKLALLANKAILEHALGNTVLAKKEAGQVINTLLKVDDSFFVGFALDFFSWYCYLALRSSVPSGRSRKTISRKAWQALDLALKGVLLPIKNMSDAGLRRGYFHREFLHSLIIKEWLKYISNQEAAAKHVKEFAKIVHKPGRLDEVFHRLLNVGVRLNAQRDPGRLPDEILEEVEELTGAERIALVLLNELGERRLVKTLLPQPPYPVLSAASQSPIAPEEFVSEIEPFVEEAVISRQSFIRQINQGADLLEQRSVLVAPLLSQGKLTGIIYTDITGCFGRFDPEDLNLLGVLANQSAVALENADWSATLEQRVTERTTELKQSNDRLEQRTGELEIINSIQQGLAKELNFQAIVDLVGDKLRDVLQTGDLGIIWYDEETNLNHYLYSYEHGNRLTIPTMPPVPGGVFEQIRRTRQPMVANTTNDYENVTQHIEGTDYSKSGIAVPIISGDRVLGLISIDNYEREYAFGEAEKRLITTIAASLGTALENARLFDETQRLLKETEQRNAELAILNSVSDALSKNLNVDAIIKIVGDKVRDTFKAEVTSIHLYNPKRQLITTPYYYDNGYVNDVPSFLLGEGLTSVVIQKHEPLICLTIEEELKLGGIAVLDATGGGGDTKSYLGVPIIIGDNVIGVVTVQSYAEYAFQHNHVSLLSTLASTMGVALANARLFQAEQERVNELQIINSIQQGLAAELDFQAIIDLVGDKLRDVLHASDLGIRWYDEKSNLLHYLYNYERGKHLSIDPIPPIPGGIFEQVSKSRQPLIGNTTDEINQYSQVIPGTEMCKSNITVPIISSDKVLGLITIENFEREYAYGEAEQRLLTTIAASLGTALENARLFDETQRLLNETEQRAAELAILNSVGEAMARQLDIKTITQLVGEKVRGIFASECVEISLYDPRSGILHPPYLYDNGPIETDNTSAYDSNIGIDSIHHAIIMDRKSLLFGTTKDLLAAGAQTWPDATGGGGATSSFMGVPIVVGEQVRGLVSVQSYREHAYDENNIRLLSTLASSMGVAIENARLFQETQRLLNETQQRNSELAIINSVQAALAAELSMQGIYDAVGDKIREIFHSSNLAIRIYDSKASMVSTPYLYEDDNRIFIDPKKVTLENAGEGFTSHVILTRETLVINENMAEAMKKYKSDTIPGTAVDKSALFVPLIMGNEARGVVILADLEREHAFSESDVRLLQTLVSSMGVALENARLFDETQRLLKETEQRNAELAILNSVSDALSKNLNIDAIIKIVGDKVRDTFQSEVTSIHFFDPKNNLITSPYSYDRGYVHTPPMSFGEGLTSAVIRNRQPLVLSTAEDDKKLGTIYVPSATGDEGITQSYIGVPIIVGENVIGVVSVQSYKQNAYQESHVSLLSTLASTMGVAIANARQFQAEQDRVAELQIINSIQQGLAAELDFQAIVDLVGDKLREVFKTGDLGITWFNEKDGLVHYMYTYEHGKRIIAPPMAPSSGGIYESEMKSRQPYLMGSAEMAKITPMPGTDRSRSAVYIPIISSDRFLGDISVENFERENAFGEAEIRLLTTIAASLGTALENARLFDETQRLLKETEQRAAELAILNSVGEAMSRQLDIKTITNLVGEKVRDIFAAEGVLIWLYDSEAQWLHAHYVYDNKYIDTDNSEVYDSDLTNLLKKSIVLDRKSLLFGTSKDLLDAGAVIYPSIDGDDQMNNSFMGVPIIVGEQVKGLVSVQNSREHAYDENDLQLLSTLSASMGVAIENATLFQETQRLLDETQRRNNELAIINSVQAALAAELNIQGIYDSVGDKIREIFHNDNLEIRLFNPVTNQEQFPYLYEKGQRIFQEPLPRIETGISAHVARTRQILVVNENLAQEAEKYGSYVMPGTQQAKSAVYVPLIVGDQVRGLVGLSDFEKEHAFSDSDVRLLQTLVNSMSVALENARLFAETQRLLAETEQRNAELAIINSVQAALAVELNIQGIYDAVGNKIREIFHSGNVYIGIYKPETNIINYPYTYEEGQRIIIEPLLLSNTGFAQHVIRTRETILVNENMQEAMEKYGSTIIPGTLSDKSTLWVPLVVGDQARGLICLSDYQHEHAFSQSDVRLLQTLANSMSVALENARLFAETQRLLEETSQRASELSIINSVSQAMSKQLEVEAIVRTVGDLVRDSLHSEVVNIYLYDAVEKLIHLPYAYDRKYVASEPFPYGSGLTSKVIDTKQPLILSSFEEIAGRGALLNPNSPGDDLMPQSYLGVPIVVGDKAIGVIDVQSYTQCVYDESHVRLLSTLASSMGVALENARLFEETRRLLAETEQRNRELAIIGRVGQSLVGQLDPQGIFELVGEELQQVFDAQVVAIITYDRLENLMHWRYSIEKGRRQHVQPHTPGGFSGHILHTRQPLLITHEIEQRAEEYGSTVLAGELPKSYLGVPLVAGGEVTGVITLQNIDREDAFNENDLRLLSTLALNMGVALENARLYQETQHHAVEMAALAEIGSDIASTHEMEPVLERMATKTRELMQVRDIALYLLQPDGRTLKAIVSQGKYAEETKAQLVNLSEGITGRIAQSGVAEIVNYPEQDPSAIHITGTPDLDQDLECIMLAPLISRGRVIGVMSVYRDREQGLFTQLELDFLVSLARQAAIAIESARLYAETERRATEMAALAEVSREISATLELHVVLERISEQACELLSAGNSAVYLLQSDGMTIKAIAAEGDVAQEVLADEVRLGDGIIGNIVKSGQAEWINDTARDQRAIQIQGTQEVGEGEKLMVAPLLIQDRSIGALAVWRDPADPPFNQAELSFAIGLAQQAVVAIENARLFESAQESQRRMADIIDFLPDATFVIDREGKVIAWNHAIEEMTGVPSQEIVGEGEYEYALPFYGERRPILIDRVLFPEEEIEAKYSHTQSNEGVMVDEAIVQLKGKKVYLNATASALRNSKGEVVGAIESIRDITDQKLAEQELHQAKLEAEQANQAKSAFLAMMSHEIRTPMNAIIGMSGLLMDTSLNLDQREFAETIRASGDSLLTIINDILDFSKIEAGKMTLEEAPFDLRECIETSFDLIKVRASEKGLELAYQIDQEVPPALLGDVTRLRQILINLLGNSVKFTEQGEVVLTVEVGKKKNSLHFSVRDTGIGIAPDRVSQLFRPFTQADASTSRRYGGTGLGLALSSRIVELMGGKMWVESEGVPGNGSTFHFSIFAKPATGWKGRPQMKGVHPQLRGRRLLVVDDNATNRRILELQTRSWGMLPKGCSTPGEALEALQKGEKYDLAILDLNMPEMSGMELANRIRQLEASHPGEAGLPLVLSTSLGGREEARESSEFAAVLLKPIRQSALFDMLISLFAGQAAMSAKPAAERTILDPEMASHHPLRILLAEDNVVNQKLALRLLSQMGYRADVAANGLEVLQAVKRQPYDVILMDVQMPEMDGLEATRRLCADVPADERPHIIAMTANAMQGDREMCLEAGMDDYLSKPIRVDELVNSLNNTQSKAGG